MTIGILVGLAAAVGALLRWGLDTAVTAKTGTEFPYGTLVVNVSGSLTLGIVTGLAIHHGLGDHAVAIIGTGLLGGFTTWSTYVVQSMQLVESAQTLKATVNIAGGIAVGLLAAGVGILLAR